MGATTPNLNLYKPGGGSTGLITPDERVDVDKINGNMDLIDAFAGTQTAFRTSQLTHNQQYRGLAADIGTVTGMVLGDTYQEIDGNKGRWRYNGTSWVTAGAVVKVRRNAAQSCGTGVFTAISFDTQVHSTLTALWTAGQPTRLVAPVTGIYNISATVGFATVTAGRVGFFFRVNGTTQQFGGALHKADNDAGISASTDLQLNASDYVEILAYQESGAAANTGTANYSMPTASMHLIATT